MVCRFHAAGWSLSWFVPLDTHERVSSSNTEKSLGEVFGYGFMFGVKTVPAWCIPGQWGEGVGPCMCSRVQILRRLDILVIIFFGSVSAMPLCITWLTFCGTRIVALSFSANRAIKQGEGRADQVLKTLISVRVVRYQSPSLTEHHGTHRCFGCVSAHVTKFHVLVTLEHSCQLKFASLLLPPEAWACQPRCPVPRGPFLLAAGSWRILIGCFILLFSSPLSKHAVSSPYKIYRLQARVSCKSGCCGGVVQVGLGLQWHDLSAGQTPVGGEEEALLPGSCAGLSVTRLLGPSDADMRGLGKGTLLLGFSVQISLCERLLPGPVTGKRAAYVCTCRRSRRG